MEKIIKSFILVSMIFMVVYSNLIGVQAALTEEEQKAVQELKQQMNTETDAKKKEEYQKKIDQIYTSASGNAQASLSDFTKEKAGNGDIGDAGTATQNILGAVIYVMRVVATGVAIIMLIWVGIKYMTSAPNERAEFKKSAMAYLVGAIVLFASSAILNIIAKFATTNIK